MTYQQLVITTISSWLSKHPLFPLIHYRHLQNYCNWLILILIVLLKNLVIYMKMWKKKCWASGRFKNIKIYIVYWDLTENNYNMVLRQHCPDLTHSFRIEVDVGSVPVPGLGLKGLIKYFFPSHLYCNYMQSIYYITSQVNNIPSVVASYIIASSSLASSHFWKVRTC